MRAVLCFGHQSLAAQALSQQNLRQPILHAFKGAQEDAGRIYLTVCMCVCNPLQSTFFLYLRHSP